MSDYTILEERDDYAFVQYEDGTTDQITWTAYNRLVLKHGLDGLLLDESETKMYRGDEWNVDIIPSGNGNNYALKCWSHPHELGSAPDYQATVPVHHKEELLQKLVAIEEDGEPADTLVSLVQDILDFTVIPQDVNPVAELPQFDAVEVRDDGWFIHDHLLLTYDNEFYHPETRGTTRNGELLDENANREAYEVEFTNRPDTDGQTSLGGFEKRMSGDNDLVEFLTRALWAVNQAPDGDAL